MPAVRFSFSVGVPIVLPAEAPGGVYSAVFEDDGRTGYLYALDHSVPCQQKIQEAMLIYNVDSVADRNENHDLVIAWMPDASRAALFIDGYAHAILDFESSRGYCRSGFPQPLKWGKAFDWDDKIVDEFMARAQRA